MRAFETILLVAMATAPRAALAQPSAPEGVADALAPPLAPVDLAAVRQLGDALAAAAARRDASALRARLEEADPVLARLARAAPGPLGARIEALARDVARLRRGEGAPGRAARIAALAERLRSEPVWLDPAVVAALSQARERLLGGDPGAAADLLRRAEAQLAADAGAAPVDSTRARIRDARKALGQDHLAAARRLGALAAAGLRDLAVGAPIARIGAGVQAAAASAAAGDWALAGRVLDDCAVLARRVAGAASPGVSDRLALAGMEIEALSEGVAAGNTPAPADLREVAATTASIGAAAARAAARRPAVREVARRPAARATARRPATRAAHRRPAAKATHRAGRTVHRGTPRRAPRRARAPRGARPTSR